MSLPLPEALKDLDYMQLTLHGGRGCFHIAKDGICGRADFWAGHPVMHKFVPLHEAVAEYSQACREAALEEAEQACMNAPLKTAYQPYKEACAWAIRALKEST